MVRFVIAIGVLFLFVFVLWMFLPAFNSLTNIINATANITGLEAAQWNFMPLVIAIIVIACIVWHYFGHRGRGGDEQ